jgi:hypothetical protein
MHSAFLKFSVVAGMTVELKQNSEHIGGEAPT